ncbi:MAG: hypothetical protein HY234_11565 [Acidobacteria bacterium]|nr:hypothetical protein [Acidobacteriota bacterium]MBI3663671.1 hypothetical protein [Acidobacteriota bacterium]
MKRRQKLKPDDFDGEGGPYSEVVVKLQIRILEDTITRSRLAVNVYPDSALEGLAKSQVSPEQFGVNESGTFVVCLSKNFNGWEDMNHDYPCFSTQQRNRFHRDDATAMNDYVADSVKWILRLHKRAMKEAGVKSSLKIF